LEGDDTTALEQALTDAKAVRDAAKVKADEADALLLAAQAEAGNAAAALAAAQTAADEANKALADAIAKDEAAKAAVAEAEKAVADAQAALDAAMAELEKKEAGVKNEQEFNPTLSTDKEDYSPGETVYISGSGFYPETVYTIKVTRPDGSVNPPAGTVITDSSGTFTNYSYQLNGITGEYLVEAKDGDGNVVATTTFTDSVTSVTVGSQSPSSVVPGNSATYTITVNRSEWHQNRYYDLTINWTAPTGASASFSPDPIHIDNSYSGTSTLTISTTGSTPAGSTNFTVTATGTNNSSDTMTSSTATLLVGTPDTTAPTGSLDINSGAASTSTLDVTLNLSATDDVGVTGYRVKNGSSVSGASWVDISSTTSFSADIPWTLSSSGGSPKTVAVQYRDAAGNQSTTYTDDIAYIPTGSITVTKNVRGANDTHHFTVRLLKSDDEDGPYVEVGSQEVYEGHNAYWGDLELDKWYKVTEDAEAGYTLHDIDPDKVELYESQCGCTEDKTIEVENDKVSTGSITVKKIVNSPTGSETFNFGLTGGTPTDFQLGDDDTQVISIECGKSYTITETDPGECWDTTIGAVAAVATSGLEASFTVNANNFDELNGSIITYTNTKKTGSITVKKIVNSPTGSETFYFGLTGGTPASFDLNHNETQVISIECGKSYTITETDPGECWDTTIGAVDAVTTSGLEASFTVNANNFDELNGSIITYTNTKKTGKIYLEKIVVGTPKDGNFEFNVTIDNVPYQGNPISIPGSGTCDPIEIPVECRQDIVITEVDPGECWNTTVESDWSEPQVSGRIEFHVDEEKFGGTVTFTNTRRICQVEVVKTIDGEGAGEGSFDFTFTGNPPSFTLNSDYGFTKILDVECGIEYTLTESGLLDCYSFNYISTQNITVIEEGDKYIKFSVTCGDIDMDQVASLSVIQPEPDGQITFDNCRKPGQINLHKTDATSGADLAGAVFRLFLSDGVTQAKDFEGDDLVPDAVTDGNGLASFSNLAWGDYIVREINPPTGYMPMEASVKIDCGNLVVNLERQIADPRKPGEITLNKSGLGSTSVAGFTLYDSNGVAVGGEQKITGNGTVSWDDLKWDTYKIVETTVPSGYNKMADITGIVIDSRNEGQQNYTFDRTNSRRVSTRGSITLNKSGLGSADTAGFTLYDSSGAAVEGEKRITGNGTVRWDNLPFDTYKIVETTVPGGYNRMSDITGIVVGTAQRNYTFDRTNSKTPPGGGIEVLGITELPFTGMHPAIPISGISSILIGGFMVVASFIRKKFGRK